METEYFVRLGNWGDVICCDAEWGAAAAPTPIDRGHRVICRTARGLELGTVTACLPAGSVVEPDEDSLDSAPATPTAKILRRTTVEDELWIARLEKERLQAIDECRQQLLATKSSAVLLDVDQLFDSATLIFYFLEPIDDEVSVLVDSLAQRFESRVRTQHFAQLVEQGCGSGCGSHDSSATGARGRGCNKACAVCVVARR